ncbi:Prolyl tripeptidyl peptidase precursor [Lacunisphaera limnophila]|uniref:Prolyl tripeptidyl peptidase n=1 Tax=Lacunisphaera limnophila TaxID=1838286 RepID=A0A1D8ATQ0_9BACT|nr:S9 family peptidase [Lacunisphaera limnophila]AOS44269.1 Prolyl tripeptidyl peptidase precursor [Lacunisphaera limnophila]
MLINHRLVRLGLCLSSLFAASRLPAAEDANLAFFRNLAETRSYTLGRPVSSRLTPDGSAVLFLRSGARDRVLHLYELDLATGQERELITPAQILGSAEETLSAEEKARRERARVTARGFTRFDLTKDGSRLLVTLSGKLYLVNRADLRVTELPGKNWIDPRFSPDGTAVAAVQDGELHVIDLAGLTERALTSGATETLTHATAEFVAQEEMDRREGYWWSPDSQWLAYQQTDESGVETRYIADPLRPEVAPTKFAYPKAGSPNAVVRLGVIARAGGETRWVQWDAAKYPYLTRIVWKEAGAPLTILVQDRAQQHQVLLAVDPATGQTRELLQESDPAWLNLDDTALMPLWLEGGRQFLWTTESRGDWQVELRDADGRLVRELTPLGFGYRGVVKVVEETGELYVKGSADPRETHVWKIPLAGGPGTDLTPARGNHSLQLSENNRVLLHFFNLLDGSSGTAVLAADGRKLGELKSVAEDPPVWPQVELTQTVGGPRSYYAALVRPRNFQPGRKYPVLLSVYAGPTTTVVSSSLRSYLKDQWMADQGYIVVKLDGRGTPRRGRDWERAVRGNLIDIALNDQIEGLLALGAQYPELDLQRVGVTGWSFGGYFSAMATLRRPDIFKAGVAGAPVITWENYDTHYTERYLGLPQENPGAYQVSSALTYVDQLERPLLLVHGLTDDNVYFQHTLQLADALFMAGKPFEILPMTGTHMAGAENPLISYREELLVINFFNQHLKSPE